ncbi:MAG: hypothetical protein WD749_07280 [Phycisphaerales bacterium]
MRWTRYLLLLAVGGAGAPHAAADLIYLSQARAITAETTYNTTIQTLTAPGFGPFVESLNLSVPFPLAGGGTGVNAAATGIDCQLDPNAIRISGSLAGSGGVAIVGGQPVPQAGEAGAEVGTTFRILAPTPISMIGTPRPSTNPGDRFQVKLENLTTQTVLFLLDETMPVQPVSFSGILPPGDYNFEFEAELRVDGPHSLAQYSLIVTVPSPAGGGVLAMAGLLAARRRRRPA